MSFQIVTDVPYSAAAERNTAPILSVLNHTFADCRHILEIGSGTGQHAIAFAAALPHLIWQCSDRDEYLAGLQAQIERYAGTNVLAPLEFDVLAVPDLPRRYDGVYSANTAHIMSGTAVIAMFSIVGKVLEDGGAFCLYGPFRQNGRFNAESNAAFDASLRRRDAAMGIRDLEDLDQLAIENGLRRRHLFAMPANNHVVIWEKHTS